MTIGIYSINNHITNKIYIGQSINIEKRIKNHQKRLTNNTHYNDYLQYAWNKYNEKNFSFNILLKCSEDNLNYWERYFIEKLDTMNREKGYNLIGGGNDYRVYSEETKKKMSQSLKKFYENNPDVKKKCVERLSKYWGRKPSLEELINNSEKYNSFGIFRINQHKSSDLKQGFRWRYVYYDNELQSTNLYDLKLQVLGKNLPWIEFNQKGKDLVLKEKKKYNPYSNYPNKHGYYRVSKEYNKKYSNGFIWTYNYKENEKNKKISSIYIDRLKDKVLRKGLVWFKLNNCPQEYKQLSLNDFY